MAPSAEPGPLLRRLLVLVQTLLVTQVALGLLLVGDDRRVTDDLHYVYGTLALGAVLAPWFYAQPAEPRRRLAWFSFTSLLAGARRARVRHVRLMRRYWSQMNPTLEGSILGLIALTIVVLNLGTALASLYVIARIAFLLALAFFFYLLWRERRDDIAVWPTRAKFVLYGGTALVAFDLRHVRLLGREQARCGRVPARDRGLRVRDLALATSAAYWRKLRIRSRGFATRESLKAAASRPLISRRPPLHRSQLQRGANGGAVEAVEPCADVHWLPDEDRCVALGVARRLAVPQAKHQVHEVGGLVAHRTPS